MVSATPTEALTPDDGLPRWIEYMPLQAIKPARRNAKRHDQQRIADSIDYFGYADAMILDERTGRLVAGHGRLDDLKWRQDTGAPPPDGIIARDGDWLAPVQRGWSSRDDSDADAFNLGLNQLSIMAGFDPEALHATLTDLADVDKHLVEVAGFSQAAIDRLAEQLEPIPPDTVEDDEGDEGDTGSAPTCTHCPDHCPT